MYFYRLLIIHLMAFVHFVNYKELSNIAKVIIRTKILSNTCNIVSKLTLIIPNCFKKMLNYFI